MSMTIAITRNVPERFDGFIKSCMHEIAPGVYAEPDMSKAVRERIWKVILEWAELVPDDGGIVIFWKSKEAPSGLGVRVMGWPKKELIEYEGTWLTYSSLTKNHDIEELKALIEYKEKTTYDDDPSIETY